MSSSDPHASTSQRRRASSHVGRNALTAQGLCVSCAQLDNCKDRRRQGQPPVVPRWKTWPKQPPHSRTVLGLLSRRRRLLDVQVMRWKATVSCGLSLQPGPFITSVQVQGICRMDVDFVILQTRLNQGPTTSTLLLVVVSTKMIVIVIDHHDLLSQLLL